MMQRITNEEIGVQVFFDRASDTDARFIPVVQWACNHVVHHINFHKLACRAWDKVAMHQVISVSMNTPLTITLPSYDEQPLLPEIDLSSLGKSFTLKPAYGGGGDGVINGATTLRQVLLARQEFPTQRYLLQAHIIPARLGSRMAWFRVIYCAGKEATFTFLQNILDEFALSEKPNLMEEATKARVGSFFRSSTNVIRWIGCCCNWFHVIRPIKGIFRSCW
jgi:hypothetical protein